MVASMGELAGLVRSALASGDLEAYQHLLAPDARWGPDDAPEWGCHSRKQILEWYRSAFDRGVRSEVTEVVAGADRLLVGLEVSGRSDDAGEPDPRPAARWQVLTVRDGLITGITGYDSRDEAAARAGIGG